MIKNYLNNPGTLKIDLMLRGTRIDDPLVKAWACGCSGVDMLLPQNTLVNIPCREEFTRNSPYIIKKKGSGYVITDGTDEVPVELVPKPDFYNKKTSTGVPFSSIASVHGSYTVITPSRRCDFFNRAVECKYCAGEFDVKGEKVPAYSVDEVLQTVDAVLKFKATEVIYLSIGFGEKDDGGIEFLMPYVKAIKNHYNCLVAVEALPPGDNRWIDEIYAAGADSLLYNLEIFDRELFELICPGRATLVGRARYMDALKYAAKVFPNGTVASHLIVGLEPPGSTCMGIDFLAGIGVVPILPIYRPSGKSSLGIDPLTTEIIIPVYKHLYRAMRKNNININWVRDISMVTTPADIKKMVNEKSGLKSVIENFYQSKIGHRAAWSLSTIRRKLRVKDDGNTPQGSLH